MYRRLQIHIDLDKPASEQIRIFSKSQRDSTETRHLLLPCATCQVLWPYAALIWSLCRIIRASLGLSTNPLDYQTHDKLRERTLHDARADSCPRKLIIEGEMVPFDEDTEQIEEFWKLTHAKAGYTATALDNDSQSSAATSHGSPGKIKDPFAMLPSTRHSSLHLMIVWFDLVLVENESLLNSG